jgi:hypothetical protein
VIRYCADVSGATSHGDVQNELHAVVPAARFSSVTGEDERTWRICAFAVDGAGALAAGAITGTGAAGGGAAGAAGGADGGGAASAFAGGGALAAAGGVVGVG